MQFNVAQLMKERTGATRSYAIHDNIEQLDPELVALDDLIGEVRLMRTLDSILVTGVLGTTIGLVCDRCLTPFTYALELELEDEFKPSIDIVSGASLPTVPEDEANLIDAHHILDLTEVIRQHILLNQPLHALCEENCLGLCPTCGQNLNEGPCECGEQDMDRRWAALRELLRP